MLSVFEILIPKIPRWDRGFKEYISIFLAVRDISQIFLFFMP